MHRYPFTLMSKEQVQKTYIEIKNYMFEGYDDNVTAILVQVVIELV